jgi:hypothetical protein
MSGTGLSHYAQETNLLKSKKNQMSLNFSGMPSVMQSSTAKLDPKLVSKQLQESIKQNQKKVTGASNIRNLIRSAATRD